MAKGKHAALFEVIHKDKRFDRPGAALRPPKGWFRREKPAAVIPPPPKVAAPAARVPPLPPLPAEAMAAQRSVTASPAAPLPKKVLPSKSKLLLDRSSKRVTFALTFPALAAGSMGLLLVVLFAFMIGKKISAGPRSVLGTSIEQLQSQPPMPGVMNLDTEAVQTVQPSVETARAVPALPTRTTPTPFNEPRPPATLVVDDAQRTIGLNYVVVQIYKEQATAEAARAVLASNGVPCTIERGLKDWARSDWFCVVGISGFDKNISRSPEYQAYLKKIQQISKTFAADSKFNAFNPQAYKWREAR